MMDFGMAALAQRHEIVRGMCATFADREDVMYFLDRRVSSFLEALFAQRVLRCVSITNALPCSAIGLIHHRRAFILIVLLACGLAVLLTVLLI
jgi:hypothetical protein